MTSLTMSTSMVRLLGFVAVIVVTSVALPFGWGALRVHDTVTLMSLALVCGKQVSPRSTLGVADFSTDQA